jgi:hypothetical protein
MKRFVLVFFCLASAVFADIESSTFIERVTIPGANQRGGKIAWYIDSNEFPMASPHHPVHVRIGLEEGVTLSETLVGPREPEIFLPMKVLNNDALMVAPANTISIVRWRQGESAIWLRISAPTDSWLEVDGVMQAPSPENTVQMVLGEDATTSRSLYEDDFLDGTANLPASQQAGVDAGTEITLDLESGSGILISYVPSAFKGRKGNVRTRAPEHAIHVGRPLNLVIYGDFFIAVAMFP